MQGRKIYQETALAGFQQLKKPTSAVFLCSLATMTNNQLWYTRREKEIRGPFPAGLITRYILLGRIREDDELSVDQLSWQIVSETQELIPEEMKLDLSVSENQEKLRIARMREDEREATDRRSKKAAKDEQASTHKRSGVERRKTETDETKRHREIKDQLLVSLRKKSRENYVSRFVWLTFVLTLIAFFVFTGP